MKLTVVGLPLGNIEDISDRAIEVLQNTQYIVCEDTRNFNNLWTKLVSLGKADKLSAKLRFVNDYNEQRALPPLLSEMSQLEKATLVSDAGMPTISDPGYKLVSEGLRLGWEVSVVPGPTAESAALAVSGLPTDKYIFLGFLPKKPGKRKAILDNAVSISKLISMSFVIYETPKRLSKIYTEIADTLGPDTPTCLAVDITKKTEKIYRGKLSELPVWLSGTTKGEATLVFHLGSSL